jgi:retron-type reverse transcriptase
LDSINNSLITLIPKKQSPTTVNDFRPISLLNSCLKLLTKLLADRLQQWILKLVSANQYGFIRGRTIQDCLAWAFEFIYQCEKSKREIIVLKLDFEKAFDMIEHDTILNILQHMGFDDVWLKWIKCLLDSGHSSILLNGVPDNSFHCKRGVRQGDPLSPLLFVAAAELLQVVINKELDEQS